MPSDNREPEIDCDAILTEINADHEDSGEEFENDLTTIRNDLEEILALNDEEVRIADAVLRQLAADEIDFTEEEKDLYNRIAPHADQLATWLKYDFPDSNDRDRWPIPLDADGDNDE